MDNLRFSINDDGVLTEYKILKMIAPSNSRYQYVVYMDNKDDIYASRYEVNERNIVLKPIEDDYEWNYIDKYLGEERNEL